MATPAPDEANDKTLLEFLDTSQLNCLNESASHTIRDILGDKMKNTTPSKYLSSDADEQLLLNLHFNQVVRIRALAITSHNVPRAPRCIKLVVNRPSIGFEDVEDADEPEVAQIIELNEKQVTEGHRIPLRFVRFQKVNSLHVFVESNHGQGDTTQVDAIEVFGVPIEATKDLSALKGTDG